MRRKNIVVLLSVLLFSLSVIPTVSLAKQPEGIHAQELRAVESAISEKGARWMAGETSMSRLTAAERRMRVGLIKPTAAEVSEVSLPPATTDLYMLAPSLDWRNNGGNYVTPVRDQRSCGSCWAFATTAALESASIRTASTPNVDLNLSEQVLVSCSGAGSCGGGSIIRASDYLRTSGLPLETCYPYSATNGVCSQACDNWTATAYKIQAWSWVATTSPTVDALRNALSTYGPLVTTMDVYADFYSYRSGIYSYVTGTYQGGHGVLLVGYDDPGQYFIVKNSWGTSWGESGYFRIAYSQLGSVVHFGRYTQAYQMAATPPPPPPPPACTYSLNPTSVSAPASGGSGSIVVTASAGCTWQAAKSVSWITITSGSSGTGNGTIRYSVSANTSASSRAGTITVAGQSCVITQAGSGSTQTPRIQASPTSLNFGSVRRRTSLSKQVTVSNVGSGTLTIGSITISPSYPRNFTQSNNCSSVGPGASCSVTVTFTPTSTGTKNGTLRIYSNDTTRNPLSVPLTGRGTY